MIYLLDVNALVALGFLNHEFHDRVAAKAAEVYAGKLIRELAYRLRIRHRRVQVSVSNKSALDF